MIKEESADKGNNPIITPKLVATPLPPLPLRKIEKMCPEVASTPVIIETGEGKRRIFLEMKTGIKPFRISSIKTIVAKNPPQTL